MPLFVSSVDGTQTHDVADSPVSGAVNCSSESLAMGAKTVLGGGVELLRLSRLFLTCVW